MKDDTIHTQDTQTRHTTHGYLTLTHRAVANVLIHSLRQFPAVTAVGQPAIGISADEAWQGIQLQSITDATILVTLASGTDVSYHRTQIQSQLTLRLSNWLERPVFITVHVAALAPVA